jgi:hypothetical protein
LEKIGIVIDYASIVEYSDSDDIDPYIIRRCFDLGVDVMFYPTPCNIREIIKYVAPENVWDMLFSTRMSTNTDMERNHPEFMDILVENNIPIYPSIFNYVDKHLEWVLDHINYFPVEDILRAYLMSSISLDVIERFDYWNIVSNFPIALNMGVWNNIRRLKHELHKDITYVLSFGITYTDPLLLWISNQNNVDYTKIIEVNITNAILVLHYLQDIKISIRGISGNSSILQMAKLYTEGYRRLCDKYGTDNTVKYAIELVNKNTKITIKPGFEDILINTSN